MIATVVGDISLQGIEIENFFIGDGILKLLQKSEINIANLESVITSCNIQIPDHPVHLRASEPLIELLKEFKLVSVANNHIHDYGKQGVLDTISSLNQADIDHVGIADCSSDALIPYTVELNGEKLAVFAVSRFCRASVYGKVTAGDHNPLMFSQIKKYHDIGYFVLVFFHWGYEYIEWPSPRDRLIARKCFKNGADIVVGSHPHVRQRFERVKGKPVVYSLGNFIFSNAITREVSHQIHHEETTKGFALHVEIKNQKLICCKLYTVSISENSVELSPQDYVIDVLKDEKSCFIIPKSVFKYIKAYNKSTILINEQNRFIRNKFLSYSKRTFRNKLKTYKSVNWQDLYNRLLSICSNIS